MAEKNWAVVQKGGSLGGIDRLAKKYRGKPIVVDGLTHEEAKQLAARRRKQLSPGEKSYYGMGYSIVQLNPGATARTKNPRGPSWEAWYGATVKIKPGRGLDEFAGKTGTVIGIEDEYLRIKFAEPVYVKGVGMVKDDLWMPHTVSKVRSKYNPGSRWHETKATKYRLDAKVSSQPGLYQRLADEHETSAFFSRNKGMANPGATWHKQRATTLQGRFRAGVDPGDTKSRMAENDFALIASREPSMNPRKRHKPIKKSMVPLLIAGGALLALFLLYEV